MSPKILILSAFGAVLFGILGSTSGKFVQPKGYRGCYKDTDDRDLPVFTQEVSKIIDCINICAKYKLPYAGLQYYSRCRCGYGYGRHGKASNCNLPCKNGGICGGKWANSVYLVSSRFNRPKRYVGCFNDAWHRDLSTWAGDVSSIEECIKICEKKKLKYAALQYYKQCQCGNYFGKHGVASESACNLTCKKGGICGGHWKNSIYRTSLNWKLTPGKFVQPKGYRGCFKDMKDRDLPLYTQEVTKIIYCINICAKYKLPYAALQNFSRCRCGYGYGRHGKASNCDLPCKNGGYCGGFWANSVYHVSSRFNRPKGYMGCFGDSEARSLEIWAGDVNTVEQCIKICRHKRKRYAGVQYYTQCRCGRVHYGLGPATCNLPCRHGGICGGHWANDVYRLW